MPAAPRLRIRIVQSRDNARIKQLRAALARPGGDWIGLEGRHLVEEALRSGVKLRSIFVRAGEEDLLGSLDLERAGDTDLELLSVPGGVLRAAVSTETPQGMAALAEPPVFRADQLWAAQEQALLLVLAGVQDPGNLGTIVRSAEAFGATGVIALPGTASVWNAKSLRASMGSAFRLPVIAMPVAEAFAQLHSHHVNSLAAVAPAHAGAGELSKMDLCQPTALWIGNEGAGLSAEMVAQCDVAVTIPCPGLVESLNAAIAASVLLYEASFQRAGSRRGARPKPRKAHPIAP